MNFLFLKLGWRTLLRDLRAGELRLLIVAVMLAVAALTAVGFFADRLKGGLQRDARQLIGGDAVLRSDAPAPPTYLAKAQEIGLTAISSVSFPTMGRATDAEGGATKLVAFKAVPAGYPLLGNMRVANSLAGATGLVRKATAPDASACATVTCVPTRRCRRTARLE